MIAHRAKKSLGQNFLIDPNQQRRIAAALEVVPGDTIVEIGPGQGALTQHIAGRAGRTILIELDRDLAAALRERYAADDTVTIIEGDVLDVDLRALFAGTNDIKVVGNIPYNITTPIIFRLLERDIRPRCIVLMIQREVADRIVAEPGAGDYGALSVGVRSVARVERLFHVGRGAFRPVPRVDSTVIRITPFSPPRLSPADEAALRELTRVAFSRRRKQLQKILRSAPEYALDAVAVGKLQQATGIDLEQRPEQLDPEQLMSLARAAHAMTTDQESPS